MYNEKQSPFNELLTKNGSVSIHEWNLQILATEIHKVRNHSPPPIAKDLFVKIWNTYNLRHNSQFSDLWLSQYIIEPNVFVNLYQKNAISNKTALKELIS